MNPTHQRRPRKAECLQYTGVNTTDALAMLNDDECQQHTGGIIVRRKWDIALVRVGSWILKGEDGKIRILSDADFLSKYEVLP